MTDPLVFARFLRPPCRRTRRARVYHWPNTRSPYNSRIATLWNLLLLFCKTKCERPVISEKMIDSKDRSRVPYQFFPHSPQPLPLTGVLAWYVRRCFDRVFHIYYFSRRSHLKMRYMPVSQSYLLYVLSFCYILYIDVTSKCIRRPRASILAMMRLSTCSSQLHAFLIVSLSIPKSPTQPPWMRWWSK